MEIKLLVLTSLIKLSLCAQEIAFNVRKCSSSNSPMIDIIDLKVTPNTIVIPASVIVSLSGNIKKQIDGPIRANIEILKKIGSQYFRFPCPSSWCSVNDVCKEYMTCPIPAGNLNVVEYKIQFENPLPVKTGNYLVKTELTNKDGLVSCFQIDAYVKVASSRIF